jgi:hypothetical protein
MTESTFARQFLAALESRPAKLSVDHVTDPRSYPAAATYTIARPRTLPQKRKRTTAPSTTTSTDPSASTTTETPIPVTLKPLRGTPLNLPPQPPSQTTIYSLKAAYASHASVSDVALVKLLFERRAQPDSKSLAEVIAGAEAPLDDGQAVMFHVVVSKGAAAAAVGKSEGATAEKPAPAVAQGVQAGAEVVRTDVFWDDLKGFLEQRVRDGPEAGRLVGLFRKAWEEAEK